MYIILTFKKLAKFKKKYIENLILEIKALNKLKIGEMSLV